MQTRRNSISDLPGSQFGSELLDVDNQVEEVRIGGIVVEVLLDECSTVRIGFLNGLPLDDSGSPLTRSMLPCVVRATTSHGYPE